MTTTEATAEAAVDGTEEVEGVTITGAEGAQVTVEADDDDEGDEGDDDCECGCGGNNVDIDI